MLGLIVLLWTGICMFFLLNIKRPQNFPPGPQPVPIFGNLLHLSLENPLKDLEKLSKCYGKVFSLYIGGRPAVIVNGFEAMKEALVTKAVDFAGRPQDLMVNHALQGKSFILSDYGSEWREQRRFALMTLRNFGLGKQCMEERILEEISHVTVSLEKSAGKTMDPQTMFHKSAFNILFLVLTGSRYDYEDKILEYFISLFNENAKIANGPWAMLYDTLPILKTLPLPFQKAFKNIESGKQIAVDLVDEVKKSRHPWKPRNFIDSYLDEIEKRGNVGSTFNEDQLIFYIMDLQFAGTDTTSNTLLTAFLYLMTNPKIQERCQQEIDMVLDGKEHTSFEDRHRMPYTQAVIHEVQRIASIVPLSVFHRTTRDTELMGYSIPKGTLIIPNLTSVLHEEGQWKFPHEFNPLNFLNQQGEFEKPEAFMPFSAGPRMCLGEGLARMELFLVIVTLLRRFRFVWPEGAGEPDYTPMFGITMSPKPFKMGVRLRLN
ncbi:cytochrome P450 2F2-like isoform X1 [Esox lucius]|uniref:Cytochrome P450, family 2, subfamily X, polypeptide 9 n=1 Tax=Esox lucius TaxID=8010 RepID=A0A6Q2WXV7_ESOLU|nr:cytochrome P450 2F2-like isoform X1 [Esox lucius]